MKRKEKLTAISNSAQNELERVQKFHEMLDYIENYRIDDEDEFHTEYGVWPHTEDVLRQAFFEYDKFVAKLNNFLEKENDLFPETIEV